MALPPNKRRVLELAREHILAGRDVHLCFAINRVERGNPGLWRECSELKRYIRKSLASFATLEEWIEIHELLKPERDQRIPKSFHDRREARVQWIDWMLAEPLYDKGGITVRAIPRAETLTGRPNYGRT